MDGFPLSKQMHLLWIFSSIKAKPPLQSKEKKIGPLKWLDGKKWPHHRLVFHVSSTDGEEWICGSAGHRDPRDGVGNILNEAILVLELKSLEKLWTPVPQRLATEWDFTHLFIRPQFLTGSGWLKCCMVDNKLTKSQKCVLVAEDAHHCISWYVASKLREVVLLCYSELVRHIWGAVKCAGLPRRRVAWKLWIHPK